MTPNPKIIWFLFFCIDHATHRGYGHQSKANFDVHKTMENHPADYSVVIFQFSNLF